MYRSLKLKLCCNLEHAIEEWEPGPIEGGGGLVERK